MKPKLVLGLGHEDEGDEGIGGHVAAALFSDDRLPEDTDVRWGRADLERLNQDVRERDRIIVVHALYEELSVGDVEVVDDDVEPLKERVSKLAFPSVLRAESVLSRKRSVPNVAHIAFMAVGIDGHNMTSELSPDLSREIPGLVERVLYELN
jgi:hydrogenase maturation protease